MWRFIFLDWESLAVETQADINNLPKELLDILTEDFIRYVETLDDTKRLFSFWMPEHEAPSTDGRHRLGCKESPEDVYEFNRIILCVEICKMIQEKMGSSEAYFKNFHHMICCKNCAQAANCPVRLEQISINWLFKFKASRENRQKQQKENNS